MLTAYPTDRGERQATRLTMAMARAEVTTAEMAAAIGCTEKKFIDMTKLRDEFCMQDLETMVKRLSLTSEEINWIFFD